MSQWVELPALEVLVAVADTGSLSGAARQLHLAQPNVSRSITRLERRFGLQLLHRSTTGSVLTPDGFQVVAWARELLSAARGFRDSVDLLRGERTEAITVSASQTIAEHLLPGWLAHLGAQRPAARITVRVANTETVMHELHAGTAQLGFVEGPVTDRAAHQVLVGEDELVLVTAPHHPWATRTAPLPITELADDTLITREPGSGTRRVLDDILTTRLGHAPRPKQELASNAAVRVAVQAGGGPAVLSRHAVAEALATGLLVEVPVAGLNIQRRLRAVWVGPAQLRGIAAELVRTARGMQ